MRVSSFRGYASFMSVRESLCVRALCTCKCYRLTRPGIFAVQAVGDLGFHRFRLRANFRIQGKEIHGASCHNLPNAETRKPESHK